MYDVVVDSKNSGPRVENAEASDRLYTLKGIMRRRLQFPKFQGVMRKWRIVLSGCTFSAKMPSTLTSEDA